MDTLQMSIINQMLQDLDKRRVDNSNRSDGIQSHIRAVPEHKNNYPAWGIGLTLAALVCAGSVSGWLWLRNPPLAASVPVTAVSVVRPVPAPTPTLSPPPIPPVIAAAVPAPVPIQLHQEPPRIVAIKPAPVIAKPVVTVRPAPVPAEADSTTQIQASALQDMPTPVLLNKQVKELTPQQITENEYRQAVVLIQQGKTADAIAALELTLQHDPQNAAARQTLAGLLIENKRPDQAIKKLQEGLTLDPSQTGMAMLLARLHIEKHDTSAAVDTLQRSLPHAGERPDYQAFIAALLQRQGHHKEAIEQYVSALRKSPQNGIWWMGLGISLQADNRLQEAQHAFSQAKVSTTLTPELQAFVEQKLQQLQK
jgi:MSHA biogenesis protein MshN